MAEAVWQNVVRACPTHEFVSIERLWKLGRGDWRDLAVQGGSVCHWWCGDWNMKNICHVEKHETMTVLLSTKFLCLMGVEYFGFIFSCWLVCLFGFFFIFGEFQRPYPKGFSNLMQHSWVHNINWRSRFLQWDILILTEEGGSEGRGRTGCPSCVLCCLEWCSWVCCVGEGKQSDMQTETLGLFLEVKSFIAVACSQWGLV